MGTGRPRQRLPARLRVGGGECGQIFLLNLIVAAGLVALAIGLLGAVRSEERYSRTWHLEAVLRATEIALVNMSTAPGSAEGAAAATGEGSRSSSPFFCARYPDGVVSWGEEVGGQTPEIEAWAMDPATGVAVSGTVFLADGSQPVFAPPQFTARSARTPPATCP